MKRWHLFVSCCSVGVPLVWLYQQEDWLVTNRCHSYLINCALHKSISTHNAQVKCKHFSYLLQDDDDHRRQIWGVGGRDPQIFDWGSLGLQGVVKYYRLFFTGNMLESSDFLREIEQLEKLAHNVIVKCKCFAFWGKTKDSRVSN